MMVSRTDRRDAERGATAILVAGSLLFLLGMAALAVDVSGFFTSARSGQTVADLACLAGVVELPIGTAEAVEKASNVTRINWKAMEVAPVQTTGATTARMGDGTGSEITFETGWNGNPRQMRVEITEVAPTNFGRVFGVQAVAVGQVATCETKFLNSLYPTLPFAFLPGGFNGVLFDSSECGNNTGNCGAISVPTDGAGKEITENIGTGLDRWLTPSLGTGPLTDCSSVGTDQQCNLLMTDPGVQGGPVGNGVAEMLGDGTECYDPAFKKAGKTLDCDSPADILGSAPQQINAAFGSAPAWWDESLYGPFATAATHYWYDGVIAKCDSPRLAVLPIASGDLDWDLGDPAPSFPAGASGPVKIVGAVDAIITKPTLGDPTNLNGPLKSIEAIVMWFGPNTTCADTGAPYGVLNGGNRVVDKSVKLIAD